MSRRSEDLYEDDAPDRRGRDPRDPREQIDSRGQPRTEGRNPDRLVPRDHRRIVDREQDSMDYTRDGYADLRTTRDPASRPAYTYRDQIDRDGLPSRGGYLDDSRDRYRQPIDLQPGRREEPSSRYQHYFLPGEDINREVIQYDICRYLGNDATVRPYNHPDGRQGYLIRAYRAPTTAMIATLKADSKRFEVEQAQRRRQLGQSGMSFGASTTFDDRQRQGRPDAPQSGYAGYGMDTGMDDYENDRVRGHRDREPRMDPRLDLRLYPWQDPRADPLQDLRQQAPNSRHNETPSISQGYSQDPSYPAGYQGQSVSDSYDPATNQLMTTRPNYPTTPETIPSGGYPVATAAPSNPLLAYAGSYISRSLAPSQAVATSQPGWPDTPNFRRDPPSRRR